MSCACLQAASPGAPGRLGIVSKLLTDKEEAHRAHGSDLSACRADAARAEVERCGAQLESDKMTPVQEIVDAELADDASKRLERARLVTAKCVSPLLSPWIIRLYISGMTGVHIACSSDYVHNLGVLCRCKQDT